MAANAPKRHHYVPKFYLRRFACVDDLNKVTVLERHRDILIADRKSIDGIGYEERLHDYVYDGAPASIEGDLNKVIETPFSSSPTWSKISSGNCASLDASDRLPIYGFAQHIQRRNLETLRFIDAEHARFLAGELDGDLSDEERDMHEWMTASLGGAHALFRAGALETMLPADADAIKVMVCRASIAFRTSTNPAVVISHPGQDSVFGEMFNSLRTWWLTLDKHWGAFIIAGGPSGFSIREVPVEVARVVNRQYLVQFIKGGARYLLADDDFVGLDLEWAGFAFEQRTTRGFRYRAASPSQ